MWQYVNFLLVEGGFSKDWFFHWLRTLYIFPCKASGDGFNWATSLYSMKFLGLNNVTIEVHLHDIEGFIEEAMYIFLFIYILFICMILKSDLPSCRRTVELIVGSLVCKLDFLLQNKWIHLLCVLLHLEVYSRKLP